MSYEVFITKADCSWEALENPIHEPEWLKVVSDFSELVLSSGDHYSRKGDDGQIEKFHPWLVTSLPDNPRLWFMDGAISATNPDTETIKFMVKLAKKLNAKVIGEQEEIYDETGEGRQPE